MVLGMKFKFLINFELIFVCGERWGCNVILLHVTVQFSQLLYKKCYLFPTYSLGSFVVN